MVASTYLLPMYVLSFGDGKKVGPKDDWNDSWRSW